MNSVNVAVTLSRPGFTLDVTFSAPARGVTALFGASGSGKTTLLRCLAGLETGVRGKIEVEGDTWLDSNAGVFRPTHARAVGYVFQEASLMPHLNVRENIEYGWRRVPAGQRRIKYDDVIDWTGVGPLLDRSVHGLSGGERNRIAIARALLASPTLLLLDEPLAALDSRARADLLPALERLHRELAVPVLYVSHSLDETARLADYMIYLQAGRVLATGELTELCARLDLPLPDANEAGAVIDATVSRHDETFHLTHLALNGEELVVPRKEMAIGSNVRVRVLARDVSLGLSRHRDTSILNIIPATVVDIGGTQPAHVLVKVAVGDAFVLARITRKSAHDLGLAPGCKVYAQVKSVALLG